MPTKHKRRWTEEKDKQLLFQWGTTKPKKLAELFGRTEVAIARRAAELKLGSYARSAETISIRQFEEESGFSRSKIRAAMTKLGMHLHRVTTADRKRFNSLKRQVALGEEQREKLLEHMLNTPISYLNTEGAGRSDAGVWGVGKKPNECLRCKLSTKQHYAKGMCKYCYGVENERECLMKTARVTTLKDVEDVRARFSCGEKHGAIVRATGLSPNVVTRIKDGWRPSGGAPPVVLFPSLARQRGER